jgi:hypothetical protein
MGIPTERELRDVLAQRLQLVEPDLDPIETEYKLPNPIGGKGFVDILARDRFGSPGCNRAFDPVLSAQRGVYGLGIAWGTELNPIDSSEIVLCTPDTIESAVELVLGATHDPKSAARTGSQ